MRMEKQGLVALRKDIKGLAELAETDTAGDEFTDSAIGFAVHLIDVIKGAWPIEQQIAWARIRAEIVEA